MTLLIFILCSLLLSVSAKSVSSILDASCLFVASNFTSFPFDCQMPDLAYKCRCQDPGFLGTVMNCIDQYSSDARDLSLGVVQLIDTCKAQGGVQWEFIGLTDVLSNATDYLIDFDDIPKQKYKSRWIVQAHKAKNEINKDNKISGIDINTILNDTRYILRSPVTVPRNLYEISHKSVVNLKSQRQLATQFGLYLYLYWIIIIIIASLSNVIQWCGPRLNNQIFSNKLSKWIKRRIICPHFIQPHKLAKDSLGNHQTKFLKSWDADLVASVYTLPLRVHVLVLLGYIILTVIFCSIKYEIVTPNTVFTCPRGQTYVAIADRTGIIGTIQLPLVFIFFTRNNILSGATGLSYRTFQVFHKWVGRVTFILLLLHCSFYLIFVHVRGDYIDRWGLLKWRCANASFTAIVITVFISFFRRFGYEFFKMSHKICLVIFCIGAWYHCITLGWTQYLIASFTIWGWEYIMRFSKIISTGGLLRGDCSLIYDTGGVPHSIRMVINHSGWWKPFPGCYCWVYILKRNMFWQAHPFTVVSATNAINYNQLIFSIRVKNGGTRTLANHISKNNDDIKVLIEGPYGNNVPFKQYNETVLIAGGVGMAVIYSLAIDLANIYRARRIRIQNEDQDSRDDQNKVSIIWVVPNLESVVSFKGEIETLKEYQDVLQLEIFITKKLTGCGLQGIVEASGLLDSEDEKPVVEGRDINLVMISDVHTVPSVVLKKSIFQLETGTEEQELKDYLTMLIEETKLGMGCINVKFQSKPHLDDVIHSNLNSINTSPTALISCGPTKMNADVRVAVSHCLKNGKCVDYFEEELLW